MNIESRIYQILLVVGTFAAAILPAWVAIETFRTQAPAKLLEVNTSFANPIESIGSLKDKAQLTLKVGGETYDNLTVASVTIANRGSSPITDTDIKSPITATVSKDWRIIAVGDYEVGGRSVPKAITWTKKNDEAIVAIAPFLLNQGELYTFPVYLTRRTPVGPPTQGVTFEWAARIVGLSEIRNTEYGIPGQGYNYGTYTSPTWLDMVVVTLTFRGVVYLFAIAFPVAWLFLHLLNGAGNPEIEGAKQRSLVIGLAFLAISIGEVAQTYINPSNLYSVPIGVDLAWLNLALALIGLLVVLILHFRRRAIFSSRTTTPDHT